MELAQSMVTWLEVQENSCPEATLWEEFSYEPLACHVWYFFLGATSQTMTPCSVFPLFDFFPEFPKPPFKI
jgi:hypothetical protein